jgi:hypothetical protein
MLEHFYSNIRNEENVANVRFEMSEAQNHVDALVSAFENPLGHLDWWDSQSSQDAVVKLHSAIRAIRASEDETNREIARLILGWTIEETSVSNIAFQAAVKQSAISQRKERIGQILNGLAEDEVMASHALVHLWRQRVSRCVRVADLPEWMRGCLTKAPGKVQWPDPRDIFWILLSAAMGQPTIVFDGAATEWLVDSRLDKQRNPKHQMNSILESFADSLSMTGSHVYTTEEYFDSLTQLGVSTSSLASVLRLMMMNPVRRAVVHSGNVLVLSDDDAKNIGRVIQRAMKDLKVQRSEIPKLLADQQQRNPKSVANELGRI